MCESYAREKFRALYEGTFWMMVRSPHDLPSTDLAIKEGKYIVEIKSFVMIILGRGRSDRLLLNLTLRFEIVLPERRDIP